MEIFLSKHWFKVFFTAMILLVGLPFFAPVFMHLGWVWPAQIIYKVYSFLCHQLPDRSFFLFGPQVSYSLDEIQAAWRNTSSMMELRQFLGSPEMGWKVAWSDRMVSMNVGVLLAGIGWRMLKMHLKPLPWWGMVLLLFPMVVDGGTHFVSDLFGGIDGGFRYTNDWLANLTGEAFSTTFYTGNAVGSFNAWMRLITGILYGIALVGFAFPYLDRYLRYVHPDFRKQKRREQVIDLLTERGLIPSDKLEH